MKARSVLFTLFGDVVRPAGGEAWLSTITACMRTVDISGEAVRTALHRMAAEGWVVPRREGRFSAYRLTDRGVARLEDAAVRIYRLRSVAWEGTWSLLVAAELTDPTTVAELEWLGYGRLQAGLWAHPHPHPAGARQLVAGMPAPATWLSGARADDDAAMAARGWALADLQQSHLEFLARWRATPDPTDPPDAFALRLRLVHDWRKFLFLDPGLPAEVLPDGWPGFTAASLFRDVYERLREPSWTFYSDLQRRGGGQTGAQPTIEGTSPFARGLEALQQS